MGESQLIDPAKAVGITLFLVEVGLQTCWKPQIGRKTGHQGIEMRKKTPLLNFISCTGPCVWIKWWRIGRKKL